MGYVHEVVKQRVKGCHCLIFESNHDLDMLKIGPYPWHVKQRVMSRQGHLSNLATAAFLTEDFDGTAQVLVLAHLSETNNHPEIARLTAEQALEQHTRGERTALHVRQPDHADPGIPIRVSWFPSLLGSERDARSRRSPRRARMRTASWSAAAKLPPSAFGSYGQGARGAVRKAVAAATALQGAFGTAIRKQRAAEPLFPRFRRDPDRDCTLLTQGCGLW